MGNRDRVRKIKNFKLSDEDRFLLTATNDELIRHVKKELEGQIDALVKRVEEFNSSKKDGESQKKKNVVSKLKRFRKDLNDEASIKKRVDLLKQKKRKLTSLNGKISEQMNKIKMKNVVCFKCRGKGHHASECPYENEERKVKETNTSTNTSSTFCYNCGQTDHNVHGCPKKSRLRKSSFCRMLYL